MWLSQNADRKVKLILFFLLMTCLCEKFYAKQDGPDMNGMPEYARTSGDWKDHLQMHGVLWKRSTSQSKWMRRYVVIRDGWLLYYPETERKEVMRRRTFNVNPKAAIPLGQCHISTSKEPGQPSAIIVASDDIEGRLVLAAENEYERDKWVEMLEKSKRITWSNQHLSDDLIRQLEEHGMAMAKQKQDYFDQLQSEVLELADEKEKTWKYRRIDIVLRSLQELKQLHEEFIEKAMRIQELERLNEELEKEKARMETFAEDMKTEYDKVKSELQETQTFMKTLDTERSELRDQLSSQETNLQSLAMEKESIVETLKHQESMTEQLSQEKQNAEIMMRQKLQQIEEQTENLLRDKSEAEMRLQENEQRALELEEEKEMYNEQAHDLQETIKDLTVQKEMTEAELKEEVMARMEAERRLKNAEISLHKLGIAVEKETPNIGEDVKEQMVVNVNRLKDFFENLAEEAKVDPDKPVVMKNAIHARKTIMRRNRNRKFERRKSSSMRAKSVNMDQVLTRGSKSLFVPRRAQSTYVRTDIISEDSTHITLDLPPLQESLCEHF